MADTTIRPQQPTTTPTEPKPPTGSQEGGKTSSAPPSDRPAEGSRPVDREPPPPPPAERPNLGNIANPMDAFLQTTQDQSAAMADIGNQLLTDQTDQTSRADQQAEAKQAEQAGGKDAERARSNTADRNFMMKSEDMQAARQRLFQTLMNSHQKNEQWSENRHHEATHDPKTGERKDDPSLKQQQFFRARGQISQGLAKEYAEAPWKQMQFKMQMPKGYNAYMGDGPRGRFVSIMTDKQLKWSQLGEGKDGEALLKEGAGEEKGVDQKQAGQALLGAAQKKIAKQMGLKDEAKETEEKEEMQNLEEEEGAEDIEGDPNDAINALRRAMGAKASKAKAKGEEEGGVEDDMPWANFGEAIESHTVLFASADHAESAQLVSQANFAGAIIMGAAIHIRLRGARLNYSGTSHHGLPIPSGDEALEMGAKELVSGLERDMGQLGVETVFVNGQRFELANKDDERKLRDLVKDNPELYQMIENIREAIRESRYYRTCMGLMEEGPGGRA